MLVFGLLLVATSCASTPPGSEDDLVDEAPRAEILYESILSVYDTRDYAVGTASREKLLVASKYEELNSELRRRYVCRVIRFQQGIFLKVTADYQRRDRSGERPVWVDAGDAHTGERARREENDLGTAIQRVFKKRSR